eukprot:COSAG05_NODE_1043_length_6061_cov_10.071285_2_plen_404_part_00
MAGDPVSEMESSRSIQAIPARIDRSGRHLSPKVSTTSGGTNVPAPAARVRNTVRIPSALEAHWLQKQLATVGKNGYMGAETLPKRMTMGHGGAAEQLRISRNTEVLMAAQNGGLATPREFRHTRRMRAVKVADALGYKRWKRSNLAPGENLSAEELKIELQQEEKAAARQAKADRSRPLVGVGGNVRIKRDLTNFEYGQGHIEGGEMAKVVQIQFINKPMEEVEEWHYLVELLESPYEYTTKPARVWLTEREIDFSVGRRRAQTASGDVVRSMDLLFADRRTDWDRLDRLSTPKGRKSKQVPMLISPQNNRASQPWTPVSTSTTSPFRHQSQAGGPPSSSGGLVFNTSVNWGTVLDNCSFTPRLAARSRKLASGRKQQLQKISAGEKLRRVCRIYYIFDIMAP